ncbi:hypothetical protein [Armatimonas sp.]|uniref:hypothetical protein n=1 Tax=Armatimonas sp. TaxID=1872638 RepID=UPI003752D594
MKPLITKAPKRTTSTAKPVTPPAANTTPTKPAAVKATATKPKLLSRPKPKAAAKPAPKPIETPLLGPPVIVAAPSPTVASTNGPLHQIPPESPSLPPIELVESVIQSKPLIITIPPESPTPPAEATILTSSGDKKASGYAVVESEVTPPVTDAAVPTGYIVVESDATPPAAPGVSEAPVPPATEDAAKPANYLVVESEIKPQQASDAAVPSGYIVIQSETDDTKKPGYSVVESDSTITATAEGTDPTATPPTPSVPTVTIPTGQAMEEVSSIQIGDVLIIAVRVQPAPAPEVEP